MNFKGCLGFLLMYIGIFGIISLIVLWTLFGGGTFPPLTIIIAVPVIIGAMIGTGGPVKLVKSFKSRLTQIISLYIAIPILATWLLPGRIFPTVVIAFAIITAVLAVIYRGDIATGLSQFFYSKGQIERGIAWSKFAINHHASILDPYTAYAIYHMNNGRTNEAFAVLEAAEKRKLSAHLRVSIQSFRALFLWSESQLNQAIEVLEQILANNENPASKVSVMIILSRVYFQQGNIIKAIELAEAALVNTQDANTIFWMWNSLGEYYFAQDDIAKAMKMLKKASEHKPPHATLYFYNIGRIAFAEGNMDEAAAHFQQALTSFDATPPLKQPYFLLPDNITREMIEEFMLKSRINES